MDLQNTGNVARVEIVNAIKEAGLKPSETNLTQLAEAVKALIKKENESKTPGQGDVLKLEVGKEIKWNMTYKGKQVYAQLFEYGKLGLHDKYVKHNIPDIEWVQLHYGLSTVTRTADNLVHPLVVGIESPIACWFSAVTPTDVYFRTGVDRSEFEATVCILYTKKSDPVLK